MDSVLAPDDDYQEQVERVHTILCPSSWEVDAARHVGERSNKARRRMQDSRYVATSIRFGLDAFITDDRAIWEKAADLEHHA
jgi:hypothetical protein